MLSLLLSRYPLESWFRVRILCFYRIWISCKWCSILCCASSLASSRNVLERRKILDLDTSFQLILFASILCTLLWMPWPELWWHVLKIEFSCWWMVSFRGLHSPQLILMVKNLFMLDVLNSKVASSSLRFVVDLSRLCFRMLHAKFRRFGRFMNLVYLLFRCRNYVSSKAPVTSCFSSFLNTLWSLHYLICSLCAFCCMAISTCDMPPSIVGVCPGFVGEWRCLLLRCDILCRRALQWLNNCVIHVILLFKPKLHLLLLAYEYFEFYHS